VREGRQTRVGCVGTDAGPVREKRRVVAGCVGGLERERERRMSMRAFLMKNSFFFFPGIFIL
jgi:hypothetical protein